MSFIFYKQHNCITQKIFQLSQVRLCGGISRFITFLHLANVLIQHDYNLMERNGHLPGSYEVMMSMYVTACTHWYLWFCDCWVLPPGSLENKCNFKILCCFFLCNQIGQWNKWNIACYGIKTGSCRQQTAHWMGNMGWRWETALTLVRGLSTTLKFWCLLWYMLYFPSMRLYSLSLQHF